ncbi:MAG TPA: Asp23/Gls24 family envelope stress response protein [Solirubrobacterales bacterium]
MAEKDKSTSNSTETETTTAEEPTRSLSARPGGLTRRSSEPLQSDRGQTNIADGVVTKVAGLAAGEVPGVHELGGTTARAVGAVTQKVGLSDGRTQGVSVEVGEREAAVDLTIVIDYGESIPQVAEEVRQQVIKRVEGITGLSVVEVNISVDDLYFPGDEEDRDSRVS